MIHYKETFETKEKANVYIQQIYKMYSPVGYGTSLNIYPQDDGTWQVKGSRGSTAD